MRPPPGPGMEDQPVGLRTQVLSGPQEPEEFGSFAQRYFDLELKQRHIPGAVLVVVKGGEIFHASGYGFSNLESELPVDPETTRFRVASLTKLFTATAAAQLIELAKLDPEADVNSYLTRFKLESNFPEPVTVGHLLTHTGGFDERLVGVSYRDKAKQLELGDYLARRLPPRVMPPGRTISYSNHGYALLGHLIEAVSGMSYTDYMTEHILRPLHMDRSTFEGPAEVREDFALGYEYVKDNLRRVPLEDYSYISPAGGLITTGSDMVQFLRWHLGETRPEGMRLFSPEMLKEMHRQHHTDHPQMAGVAYGFFESFYRDQKSLFHTGGAQGFGSLLFLLPEHALGVFLGSNRMEQGILYQFPRRFLSRYFPPPSHPDFADEPDEERSSKLTGTYRHNRYARRTLEKAMAIQGELNLEARGDGGIALRYANGVSLGIRRLAGEEDLYQRRDRGATIGFREDASGRVSHMFISSVGMTQVHERLRWFQAVRFQMVLGLILVAALILSLLGAFLPALSVSLGSTILAALTPALQLAFLALMAISVKDVATDYWEFGFGLPLRLRVLLLLPLLSALLTAALSVWTVAMWLETQTGLAAKLYLTFNTASNVASLLFLRSWNLLGRRY